FAFLLGLGELMSLSEEVQVSLLISPLWQLLQLVIALVVASIFASRILLASLDRVPLEGHLRRRAENLAEAAGIPGARFFEWRTDHEFSNAMVIAQPPFSWQILFTDRLLDSLGPEEIEAVLAHELGHIRGGHARSFLVWVLAAAIAFTAAAPLGLLGAGWEGTVIGAGLLLSLILWIGFMSRRFELEADLFAAQWKTEGLSRALLELASMTGLHHKSGYRHFSTARRILFLRSFRVDKGVGQRLQATVRGMRRAGLLFLALSLALVAWAELQVGSRSDVVRATQLGQYPRAKELLDRSAPALDDSALHARAGFERLIAFGASLAGERDSLSGDELAEEALTLLTKRPTAKSLAEVTAILDLAIMRHFGNAPGERDLRRKIALQVSGFKDIGPLKRSAELAELPGPWRKVAKAAVEILGDA
ncbi:MAG: M48 family metalloprotease, partial [Planctomycetota bacterium]|nr:M48 family metalloprotease [Planctomycetota bacterium]